MKRIKFMLNGCDISFVASAPADMTVEQLVKQASRVKPLYCACGVCYAEEDDKIEIVFDYDNVQAVNDDVSCVILDEEEVC